MKIELQFVHFFFQLFSYELLGMSSHFIHFVAENKHWNFLPHYACPGQNFIKVPFEHKTSYVRLVIKQFHVWIHINHTAHDARTLMLHDSLARIAKHPQQKLSQLLEVRIHLVWVKDENAQERQQCEQDLFFPSVK